MKPRDFFETAALLNKESEESHLRTSLSRSYYALFLYFRDLLLSNGIKRNKYADVGDHRFVIECLDNCKVRAGEEVAIKMRNLQQSRVKADYDLNQPLGRTEPKDNLEKARRIINKYNKVDTEDAKKIMESAHSYADLKGWL